MMRKKYIILPVLAIVTSSVVCYGQSNEASHTTIQANSKSQQDAETKAAQCVAALSLTDTVKANRVKTIITTHLTAVRDWHNSHPYTSTPEGINPVTGKVFTKLERELIVDSTIPKAVHDSLMTGLKRYLTEDQVAIILDKYTIGKVQFTMNGYKSIVPNLTPADEDMILTNLKLAREQSVDYKDIKEISIIFKIYKTKIEDYFTSNGRNWKQMYQAYFDKQKGKKAAEEN